MTRLAVPLGLALLLLLPVAAQANAPVPPSVWTVLTTVQADVKDGYATVRVIADIANRGPDPEFPFRVTVPDDAFVTGLTIEREGEVYVAQIAGRETARETYEREKAAGQTAGLVEKQRHSTTFQYLINVAERTSVRATLTYEEYLPADRGVYNLSLAAPVSGFGRDLGARFDVAVQDEAGVASLWGAQGGQAGHNATAWFLHHEVGPREGDAATPFTASYTLASDPSPGGSLLIWTRNGTGYFAHRIRAAPDAERLPVDMVLALDVSGSMSGQKIAQLRDAAGQVVRALGPEDRLLLVEFSSAATKPWGTLRAMDATGRAEAAREVESLLAGGGTNLEAALREGLAPLAALPASEEERRLPMLVLLTDGQATEGERGEPALLALADRLDTTGSPIFTIAFGGDADAGLLHALAARHDGIALQVPEGNGAEVDLRNFLAALATPTLRNVAVTYGPGVVARHADAPVLFAGSELLVVGTYDLALGMPTATVRAVSPQGARNWTVSPHEAAGAAWLPRLVAYQQARELTTILEVGDLAAGQRNALRDIGLEWGFVTDETSLVLALEPQAAPDSCNACFRVHNVSVTNAGAAPQATSYDLSSGDPRVDLKPTTVVSATPADTGDAAPAASSPTPAPKVPAPGLALAVVALAAVALLARGARRG